MTPQMVGTCNNLCGVYSLTEQAHRDCSLASPQGHSYSFGGQNLVQLRWTKPPTASSDKHLPILISLSQHGFDSHRSHARRGVSTAAPWRVHKSVPRDLLGIVVQPLDFDLVNVGSIPTGPTHGEGCLQPHPGDVLKSTPNVRKSARSGLNLEGRLSDPQF